MCVCVRQPNQTSPRHHRISQQCLIILSSTSFPPYPPVLYPTIPTHHPGWMERCVGSSIQMIYIVYMYTVHPHTHSTQVTDPRYVVHVVYCVPYISTRQHTVVRRYSIDRPVSLLFRVHHHTPYRSGPSFPAQLYLSYRSQIWKYKNTFYILNLL